MSETAVPPVEEARGGIPPGRRSAASRPAWREPRSLVVGADGLARCAWVGDDELYRRYHDEEWGVPKRDDRVLFEKLCLEGFQAGLSWITILRRREGFRAAFAGFDPEALARWGEAERDRLVADDRIIRNRAKIEATIGNARALLALQAEHGPTALTGLIWSFAPAERSGSRPRTFTDLPAATPESLALSTALKRAGFRFVGATTVYALMQSAGLVDDHIEGCHRVAE